MRQRVGVVLAGGSGERLGVDKASLEVDGRTLADRAAHLLWPFCGSVMISVRPGGDNPAPDFPTVEDSPPAGRGPLAGILAAYQATQRSDLVVLACDYPLIDPPLIRMLLSRASEEYDLVFPTDAAGRDHPLVGLWCRSAEGALAETVERGLFKVRSFLVHVRAKRLGPAEFPSIDLSRGLLNLNWPADLETLRREGRVG